MAAAAAGHTQETGGLIDLLRRLCVMRKGIHAIANFASFLYLSLSVCVCADVVVRKSMSTHTAAAGDSSKGGGGNRKGLITHHGFSGAQRCAHICFNCGERKVYV